MIFKVAYDLVDWFKEKINKSLKKLKNYGSYEYHISNAYIESSKESSLYGKKVVDIDVQASYKIVGYEFIASLEFIDEVGENLIKKISEDTYVPAEYKTRCECDHCKTKRRRKYTIILKKDDEYIQVGKSCIKDFLGVDLANYVRYLSLFKDLEDFLEYHHKKDTGRSITYFEVDDVLGQAIEETSRHGYISKNLSIENACDSTASRVWQALNKIKNLNGEVCYQLYEISNDTKLKIQEIKKFYLENSFESDYINNIKTILQVHMINGGDIGLVVSAVGTKLRLEKEAKEKVENIKSVYSFYAGEIGQRIDFKGKIECIYTTESIYGWFYIYKIVDEVNKNFFIWKTTSSVKTDAVFAFKGTIKNFSEYGGEKQTEVTRVKIIEEIK